MSDKSDNKPTAGEKRAAKRKELIQRGHNLAGTGKGSTEPTISQENYMSDLMDALNYYNISFENKEKRKWVMQHLDKPKQKALEDLPDYHFRSLGTILRLKNREQYLAEKEFNYIDKRIQELLELAKAGGVKSSIKVQKVEEDKPAAPVSTIQDKIMNAASTHIGEFEGMIDEFVLYDKDPDFASYLKANEVSPQVSRHIPKWFDKSIKEIKEVLEGKDEQLVEGYSNFTKPKLKKLLKHYEAIADACNQQVVSAKRKPRTRKEKPASVLAAKVKYMKEYPDLDLKSELPQKIVGASEVWIYNTKYKKLQAYRAADDGKLSVKGTTIIGYEVATSGSKTLRKPELVKDYAGLARKTLAATFKALKTKESAVNGRINEECIILKVF